MTVSNPSPFSLARKEYVQAVNSVRVAREYVRVAQATLAEKENKLELACDQMTDEFRRLNEYEQDFLGGIDYIDDLIHARRMEAGI